MPNIRKHILFHAFDASNMHLMQVAWCSMQHPFQCFLLTFYIIFKISEWNWKNAHRSTAHVHLFVSGGTQTSNRTKSAPSPKSFHQPNQFPTKTHRIQAVVERTFAGKTTCNSIPRLGGLKVFWKSQVFSTRKTPPFCCVFFVWLNIPRWFCGFLWRWYFYSRIC